MHIFLYHSQSSLYSYIYPSPTHFYTLSLHDALPISEFQHPACSRILSNTIFFKTVPILTLATPLEIARRTARSEEHTSELQSPYEIVCRLLLEKKKSKIIILWFRNRSTAYAYVRTTV